VAPKTLELEHRLARIELTCNEFRSALLLMDRRLSAIQAQLDYFAAKLAVKI
jgi:hypothetical protein